MSWKSKIYVAPGTELDWDNEDHRRHIEEEAFQDPPRPRPTLRTPERSRTWWLWRTFGLWVFRPARWMWRRFSHWKLEDDGWRAQYALYPAIRTWLERGARKGRSATLARRLVHWLFVEEYSCPTCGFEDFDEEICLDGPDGESRTIDLFEYVDGGGLDYFGEANDYHGWQWCYRCGDRTWETH